VHQRQAEVAELGGPVVSEPDVSRLQIAVNHTPRVRVLESPADVLGDVQCPLDGQPVALAVARAQQASHVAAGHVLAHDVRPTRVFAHVEDRHDVRMTAQPAHRLRFVAQPDDALGIEALGPQQREGDRSVQVAVMGQVDELLGALAEQSLDDVAPAHE
jgi:hypothetical protein